MKEFFRRVSNAIYWAGQAVIEKYRPKAADLHGRQTIDALASGHRILCESVHRTYFDKFAQALPLADQSAQELIACQNRAAEIIQEWYLGILSGKPGLNRVTMQHSAQLALVHYVQKFSGVASFRPDNSIPVSSDRMCFLVEALPVFGMVKRKLGLATDFVPAPDQAMRFMSLGAIPAMRLALA